MTDINKSDSLIPSLVSTSWRVDVILSSSSINNVMQPFVILRIKLSDGSYHSIEMNINSFHELRFRVAEALHSMNKLQSNYLFTLRDN